MSSAAMYECPRCVGTGTLESSDSTDDSWWDCPKCEGTGKLADRRRLDPAVAQRDALLDALDGIVRAAIEYGVNDQVGEALAYADKIVARRIRERSITGGYENR